MIARHRLNRNLVVCCCGFSVLIATAARGQEVRDTSYIAPDGSRVLQQSIVVPATAGQVWDAFTTAEGMQTWAVPVVHVDFRPGGIWESAYSLDGRIGAPGNIKNRILSFLPIRMLSFQVVAAPPGFAHAELLPDIVTVIELDELAPSSVRVTESMVGYKPGEGYDTLYRSFEAGNAWSLRKLHQRFIEGPIDWQKTLRSSFHGDGRLAVPGKIPRLISTARHLGFESPYVSPSAPRKERQMRVKHVGLAAVFLFVCGNASSAESASITGVVVDARTERPLAGVFVSIESQPLVVETDKEGRFSLSVPPGQYVLAVSLVGYAMTRQALDVTSRETKSLTILLSEGAGAYQEYVTVSGARSSEADASLDARPTRYVDADSCEQGGPRQSVAGIVAGKKNRYVRINTPGAPAPPFCRAF